MDTPFILVTGGAGYIGAHTCYELAQSGYQPVIIDDFSRSDRTLLNGLSELLGFEPHFHEGSCLNSEFLDSIFRQYPITGVLHFAAFKSVGESVRDPLSYFRNNLDSLVTLMQVMQNHKVSNLVFSSSCTVYGQPKSNPVSEEAPFQRAESPYGATKQMCERILEDAFVTGFKIVSLRYFNPVGAHPSALLGELPIGVPNNLVPYVTQTAIGKREKLVVFGNDYNTPDGSNIRDFIHVVDLAKAHVSALNYLQKEPSNKFFDVFNLGTGAGVSVLELIKTFEKVTGVKVNYEIGSRRPGDVVQTFADPSKAKRVLGWQTERTLSDALQDAWRWEKKLNSK